MERNGTQIHHTHSRMGKGTRRGMGWATHGREGITMEMVTFTVPSRSKPDCTGDATNAVRAQTGISQ